MSPTTDDESGRSWAPRTRATYAADWALFTDWCDATDHMPLPADPTTVLEFLADCPAAPATRRRRVIAIDHHHTATGYPPPGADPRLRDVLGRPPTEPPPATRQVRERVDAALRVLPSRGWTGGLFGRRDRCLLVLSQSARIPHRHLARLTAGDVTVADRVATIMVAGETRTVQAVDDPVLCGPCAVARWLRVHRVLADPRFGTRTVAELFDRANEPTDTSAHACRGATPSTDEWATIPLLPPIDQWGACPPFPMTRLSPHAVSRHTRDLLAGVVTAHRVLPVHPAAAQEEPARPGVVAAPYTQRQWRTGWDRRRADLTDLAGVADELDAVDRRAAEINQRIDQLLTMATAP